MSIESADSILKASELSARIGIEQIILNQDYTNAQKIDVIQQIYASHNRVMDYIELRLNELMHNTGRC